MRIGHFQFRSRLIPTLVTLILLPVLISLGFWQLSRAEEKREILAKQEQKRQMPALHITGNVDSQDALEHRELVVKGKYLPEYQILVDNKVHNGQVGYYVVTPLRIVGTESIVLVNRGWIKGTGRREVLPAIQTPESNITIHARAKFVTKDIVTWFSDKNRLGTDWPALVRWIDIMELNRDIPFELKPYLLLQTSDSNQDYVRNWKWVNSPPEKNITYAVQWFSLAATLLLIFVFVNTKRLNQQVKS